MPEGSEYIGGRDLASNHTTACGNPYLKHNSPFTVNPALHLQSVPETITILTIRRRSIALVDVVGRTICNLGWPCSPEISPDITLPPCWKGTSCKPSSLISECSGESGRLRSDAVCLPIWCWWWSCVRGSLCQHQAPADDRSIIIILLLARLSRFALLVILS